MSPTKLDFEITLELKEILEREASMLIHLPQFFYRSLCSNLTLALLSECFKYVLLS